MRYKFMLTIIFSIVTILLARVYFLSVESHNYYEKLSERNSIKRVYKAPPRGIIRDRNNIALAIDNLGFSINIKPHIRNKKELEKICDLIVKKFPQYNKEDLIKKYRMLNSPYQHDYVQIVDYIPYNDFFKEYTKFNILNNVKIEPALKRYYPYKEIAAHVIGYIGKASPFDVKKDKVTKYSGIIGKNGLEKYYNTVLEGKLGYEDIQVNALNKEVAVIDSKKSTHKNDLNTTLDIKLQKYIHKIFDKDDSGVVIVMNANNGEILASATFPEFDNNIFINGISTKEWQKLKNNFNHPFTNKIINGLYPPGSVIKMGVAISFLENGVPPDYHVYSTGEMKLGNRYFRDWRRGGHGKTGFEKALRESCDDFFYAGSLKVGINKISKTLAMFGFGEKTGVDLPNEFDGINPNKTWKKKKYNQPWYIGETVISSIGQGYTLVTPLQIARYTASIATGKLPTPHFTQRDYKKPIDLKIPKKYLKIVQEGMYEVANYPSGTASRHIHTKFKIAAKTGTAQVVGIPQSEKRRMKEYELEYYQRSHAWLTTYGPYKNPQFVVTVIIEHGGHGGSAAGEMVSKIYNKLDEMGYIK